MKYIDKVTAKIIIAFLITIVGIPAYFYFGGSWQLALLYTVIGHITNNLAQIAYHRWLCHDQFEPSWLGRKILLACTVVSAVGPPGHNVVAHLNHHKHSDSDLDTHSPADLGWWRMLLGRYRTPSAVIPMRRFAVKRDAVYVTKHYWKLYVLSCVLHALIDPWLLVWKAFNFTHAWYYLTYLNYHGHSGPKAQPATIDFLSNMIMWGEGYHDEHHKNARRLVLGKWDIGGKYVVPLLSKSKIRSA